MQSFSFNDRQTGRDNKHEKQIERHMGKWGLGMRGRRKSNRHKRNHVGKKEDQEFRVLRRRSRRDRHTTRTQTTYAEGVRIDRGTRDRRGDFS